MFTRARAALMGLLLPFAIAMPTAAATPEPPLYPSASIFDFSSHGASGATKAHALPQSEVVPRANAGIEGSAPAGRSSVSVGYDVYTFRSAADARWYNTSVRTDIHTKLVKIAHPVAPEEWLSVNPHLNYVDIYVWLTYRNLDLSAGSEVDYSNLPYKEQQRVTQQAIQPMLDMEAKLFARAQDFATGRVHNPSVPMPLTPKEQARNHALQLMVNFWNVKLSQCEQDIVALHREIQTHSYTDLDALYNDATGTHGDCLSGGTDVMEPDQASNPPAPPRYIINALADPAYDPDYETVVNAVVGEARSTILASYNEEAQIGVSRDNGPDFPADVRDALLSYLNDASQEIANAHAAVQSIERKWRMTP